MCWHTWDIATWMNKEDAEHLPCFFVPDSFDPDWPGRGQGEGSRRESYLATCQVDKGGRKKIVNFWVVVSNIFHFHPYLGKWSNLTNIFQMSWNHQLDLNGCLGYGTSTYIEILGGVGPQQMIWSCGGLRPQSFSHNPKYGDYPVIGNGFQMGRTWTNEVSHKPKRDDVGSIFGCFLWFLYTFLQAKDASESDASYIGSRWKCGTPVPEVPTRSSRSRRASRFKRWNGNCRNLRNPPTLAMSFDVTFFS